MPNSDNICEDNRKASGLLEFTLKDVQWRFRWCPAGSFMMGSPANEAYRDDDKKQHAVKLTQGFWMQETEITQTQWQAVMGNNPSIFKGNNLPVESVSWNDCQEFVKKLNTHLAGFLENRNSDLQVNRLKGYKFALPTEAQWEYAARAGSGSTTAYCFGDDDTSLSAYAWYYENSDGEVHPVGQLKPNAWNLYDMHGNLWEWCQDWFGEYGDDTTDHRGAASGGRRVVRGGSWEGDAEDCRSAKRDWKDAIDRYDNLGVRVCLVLIE